MRILVALCLTWNVSGQLVQPDHQEGKLCRCELPGENIYDHGVESYVPLRIGDFYVLDEHHESCEVSQTPLVDAVVHGIQHWSSFFYHRADDAHDDPHRSLWVNKIGNPKATTSEMKLRSLSHTDGDSSGGIDAVAKHGIAVFPCPPAAFDSISDSPSFIAPTPSPQGLTPLPSVQVPTLDIIDTNLTTAMPAEGCPANTTALSIDPDEMFIGTFDMAVTWNISSCSNDTDAMEERTAVWVSVIGTGALLQVSTCAPETSFLTSVQVISGDCSNISCVVENEEATGNCPSPNIFGSTVTWSSEPNEQYWILVFPRGDETVSSSDQFGLTVVSLVSEPEETPVPTAAPISNIFGRATLYPTAAPLTNINPVYQGAYILDDNHSCENAERLFARNFTSDSILGTTIGAPNTITCWSDFDTPTVWFSVIGTGQTLEVTMSERILPFPPLLSVLGGVSCDEEQLECVARGLDTVEWQSNRGERYFLLLQGRLGAGDYGLMIRSYE